MYKYADVKQVHLEPTQLCQASCPMCDRNKNGGEVNQYLKDQSLTLEAVQKLFEPKFVKQLELVYFCGNHGDPIFAPDMAEMAEYFREHNPNIHLMVSTNGGARKPEWWEKLAKLDVTVNFSVDGLEDTNHLYRQGVKWKHVEENMDAFISAGGYAKWTFLVFNYNEHQVEEAERFAKLLGVKEFIVKKSGRYLTATGDRKGKHQAVNRKGDLTTLLSEPTNPKYQNKALQQEVDVKQIVMEERVVPKCQQKKEIYVSAEGYVHPCCWTAGRMYKWYLPPKAEQIWENIEAHESNALKTSIQHVMEGGFFESIEKRWTGDNRLDVCVLKCNKKFDPFTAQWK